MFDELTTRSNKCLAHLEVLEEAVLTEKSEQEPTSNNRISLVSIDTTSSTTSSARSTRDSIWELYERNSYHQRILAPRESPFQEVPEVRTGSTTVASAASNLEQLLSHELSKSGKVSISAKTLAPVDMSYYYQSEIPPDEIVENARHLLQTEHDLNSQRFNVSLLLRSQGDGDLAQLVYSSENILPYIQFLRDTRGELHDTDPESQEACAQEDQKSPKVQLFTQTTKRQAAMRVKDYEFWKDALDEDNTDHASHLIVVHKSVKFAAICIKKSPAFSVDMGPEQYFEYLSCEEGQV